MPGIIPGNPVDVARNAQLAQALANIPPEIRGYVASQYDATQITVLPLPYWSTVRFQATRAAGPPVAMTITAGTRRAFTYAQGQDMTSAGFTAATTIATPGDTNLLRATETRDNSDFWIWGLACNLMPNSEPALAARIWRETYVDMALNGTQSIPLGCLEMFPGAGGLYGQGRSFLKSPDGNTAGPGTENGAGASFGFVQNGNPMAGNFFRFPQPFKWAAVGSAGSDSALSIGFTTGRDITENSTARTAVPVVAMVSPAQIAGFTPPAAATDFGGFVEVRVHLVGVAVSKRSVNV